MMFKVSALAIVMASLAVPAMAQTDGSPNNVTIKDTYARVIYRPEDRSDYVVTVSENGSDQLPALQIRQSAGKLEIEGGVTGSRRGIRISQCRNGDNNTVPQAPGQGGSVVLSGIGRLDAAQAPLLIIRGPRNADIRTSGAVFGTVTRGTSNVNLRVGGCGGWVVANTQENLGISIGGTATVWAGTARDTVINVGGSGRISTNAVRSLRANIGGSGDINVASVDGDVDVRIGGSGSVRIAGGTVPTLTARVAGSGDIDFGGTVGDLDAVIAGAGGIEIHNVTGNINRRVIGVGRIKVNGQAIN